MNSDHKKSPRMDRGEYCKEAALLAGNLYDAVAAADFSDADTTNANSMAAYLSRSEGLDKIGDQAAACTMHAAIALAYGIEGRFDSRLTGKAVGLTMMRCTANLVSASAAIMSQDCLHPDKFDQYIKSTLKFVGVASKLEYYSNRPAEMLNRKRPLHEIALAVVYAVSACGPSVLQRMPGLNEIQHLLAKESGLYLDGDEWKKMGDTDA